MEHDYFRNIIIKLNKYSTKVLNHIVAGILTTSDICIILTGAWLAKSSFSSSVGTAIGDGLPYLLLRNVKSSRDSISSGFVRPKKQNMIHVIISNLQRKNEYTCRTCRKYRIYTRVYIIKISLEKCTGKCLSEDLNETLTSNVCIFDRNILC